VEPEIPRVVFKNADLLNLFRGLNSLDGRLAPSAAMADSNPALIPYKFGGKARITLARWLAAVKSANDTLSAAHDALVRQFIPVGEKEVPPARRAEFQAEWDKVMDDTVSFELPKVPVDELFAEDNQLPVSVLAVLSPILA